MNVIRKSVKKKLSRGNSSSAQLDQDVVVDEPLETDILLGRSKTNWSHVGNRKFRVFVGLHLKQYMESNSRMEKTMVVNSIVEAIGEAGGRFLKQDAKTKQWHGVSSKMAREKVGHALRDAVSNRIKLTTDESSSHGSQKVKVNKKRQKKKKQNDIQMERAPPPERQSSAMAVLSSSRTDVLVAEKRSSKSCSDLDPSDSLLLEAAAFDLDEHDDDHHDDALGHLDNHEPKPLELGQTSAMMNQELIKNNPQHTKDMHDLKQYQGPIATTRRKSAVMLDSGEFSIMSVNREMFEEAQSSNSEIFEAAAVEEVLPKEMVSQVSRKLVDMDISEELRVAQSSGGVVRNSSTKSSAMDALRAFEKSQNGERKTAHFAKEAMKEFDVSEELSLMSISGAKEKLVSDDQAVAAGDAKPASAAALKEPVEIKAKSDWEQEISEDFSVQSPTRSKRISKASVVESESSDSFEVPPEVAQIGATSLNVEEISEEFGMSLPNGGSSGTPVQTSGKFANVKESEDPRMMPTPFEDGQNGQTASAELLTNTSNGVESSEEWRQTIRALSQGEQAK